VFEQIGAVTVIAGMRNVQACLVQPRGPAQHGFRQGVFQSPGVFDLLQQRHRGRFDAVSLHFVDVVALLHGAHAAHARIFIGESSHEIV
jgi:hypothetical protein